MFDHDIPLFIKTVREHKDTKDAVAHLDDRELGGVFEADYRTGWSAIGGKGPAVARIKWLIKHEGKVRPPRNYGGFGNR